MRLTASIARATLGLMFVFTLATLAEAQAPRTWVSGVGDDANPCSRTAPCKTFAGAISKTATNGEIDVLDPGGFGAVTITKSITIDGSGGSTAGVILSTPSTGIIVNSASNIKVTLRNLDIEGMGAATTGIKVLNVGGGSVHVVNCNIRNFTAEAINFTGGNLFVANTIAQNNFVGVLVASGRATIDHFMSDANNSGLKAGALAIIIARDSYFSGGGEGMSTSANSAIINVVGSVITNNTFGVNALSGGTVRLSNTDVLSNGNTGLFNDGASQIISLSGNSVQGNPVAGAFTQTFAKQ